MRISYKVWLVGGIPIAIAAAIAVVSWLPLKEAERARDGVVLASTIYRNPLLAMTMATPTISCTSCSAARPGGNNIAKWCHADYDALVNRAKQTAEQAERARLYGQAQEIVKREAPWVPLAHSVVLMATRKTVKGFRMDPLGRILFEGVDLAE